MISARLVKPPYLSFLVGLPRDPSMKPESILNWFGRCITQHQAVWAYIDTPEPELSSSKDLQFAKWIYLCALSLAYIGAVNISKGPSAIPGHFYWPIPRYTGIKQNKSLCALSSAKDSGSVKKARDLLNHLAFGTEVLSGMSADYNKPLLIPPWSDSFAAITNDESGNVDMMKHHFCSHFPQKVCVDYVILTEKRKSLSL